jgi:hypothetical protein
LFKRETSDYQKGEYLMEQIESKQSEPASSQDMRVKAEDGEEFVKIGDLPLEDSKPGQRYPTPSPVRRGPVGLCSEEMCGGLSLVCDCVSRRFGSCLAQGFADRVFYETLLKQRPDRFVSSVVLDRMCSMLTNVLMRLCA